MSPELCLGKYLLPSTSKGVEFTQRFVAAYQAGLTRLRSKKVEGLAVMAATHQNFYGNPVAWELFRGIDPSPRLKDLFGKMQELVVDDVVQIGMPEYKSVGVFQAHFNPIRGLRPRGTAGADDMPIDKPFDPKAFHLGKVNAEEVFLTVDLDGKPIELLYNLFPFAPFHFLLVPDRNAGLPQSLADPAQLQLGWEFLQRAGDPNLRLAFNSLGAYASFPHMHWQGFYNTAIVQPPIDALIDQTSAGVMELATWPIQHTIVIKGERGFILSEAHRQIREIIKKAQNSPNTIGFNIYMKPDSITVIPRKHQKVLADYVNTVAPFTTGPAFFESIGIMIMPLREYYDQTTEAQLKALYQFMSVENSPQVFRDKGQG